MITRRELAARCAGLLGGVCCLGGRGAAAVERPPAPTPPPTMLELIRRRVAELRNAGRTPEAIYLHGKLGEPRLRRETGVELGQVLGSGGPSGYVDELPAFVVWGAEANHCWTRRPSPDVYPLVVESYAWNEHGFAVAAAPD